MKVEAAWVLYAAENLGGAHGGGVCVCCFDSEEMRGEDEMVVVVDGDGGRCGLRCQWCLGGV